MAYHFNEYQKVFGQLQYAQLQSNTQTVQNLKNNGAYHFQQYQMRGQIHSLSVSSNNSGLSNANNNSGVLQCAHESDISVQQK